MNMAGDRHTSVRTCIRNCPEDFISLLSQPLATLAPQSHGARCSHTQKKKRSFQSEHVEPPNLQNDKEKPKLNHEPMDPRKGPGSLYLYKIFTYIYIHYFLKQLWLVLRCRELIDMDTKKKVETCFRGTWTSFKPRRIQDAHDIVRILPRIKWEEAKWVPDGSKVIHFP